MRFDGARTWYIGAALAAILVLAAGWFLLISPQRGSADDLNAQADQQVATNKQLEAQIQALKAQYKDLPALQQQLAATRSRIPLTPNMPSLIRSLNANATTAGVTVVSFTPSNPAPRSTTVGSTGDEAINAPGQVLQYPVSLKVTGRFANVRLFLASLEQLKRSFLVTNIDIKRDEGQDGTSTGQLVAIINGAVFSANEGTPVTKKPATTTTTTTTDGAAAAATS